MSLKVWYPLVNGLYKNQGSCCDGDIYSTSSFTSENVGNLGTSTYNGGDLKWNEEKTSKIFNNKQLSIAFWIKPLDASNGGIIFGNDSNGVNNNNRKFSLFQFSSDTTKYGHGISLHWSWMNDEAGKFFAGGTLNGILPINKWTHVVFAYNNPVLKIYINGILKHTSDNAVSNSSSFTYETTVFHQNSNRYIQDLRIYNHCLSEYEIKELSKGLCCHYSFDGWCPKNEFVTIKEGANSIGGGCSVSEESPGVFKAVPNNSEIQGFIYWNSFNIAPNTKYVFSCDVYNSSNSPFRIYFEGGAVLNSSNYQGSNGDSNKVLCEEKNTWIHIYGVFTSNSTGNTNNIMFYPKVKVAATEFTNGYQLYKNIRLYKGDTYLGENATENLNDNSGFNNNSIKVNNVGVTSSKIGSGAGLFNGTSSYIALPQSCKISGPFTYNIWAYMDNWSEYGNNRGRIISCTEGGRYNIEAHGNNIHFVFYDGTGGTGSAGYGNNILTDVTLSSLGTSSSQSNWHMFTFSLDPINKTAKAYIDSILVGEKSNIGTFRYSLSSNMMLLGAEPSGESIEGSYFKGKLDDFKLYASCLSDEDIKDLYSCRMKISNNHNVYCSEFIESDSNSSEFKENGQILMGNFTEGGIARLKIHSEGNNSNNVNHLSKLTINKGQDNEQVLVDAQNHISKDILDGLGVKFSKELSGISSPNSEYAYYDNIGTDFIITFTPPVLISNIWLRRYYNGYTYINSQIAYSVDNEGDDNWVIIHKNNDYPETAEGKYFYLNGNINSKSGIYNNKLLSCKEIIEE